MPWFRGRARCLILTILLSTLLPMVPTRAGAVASKRDRAGPAVPFRLESGRILVTLAFHMPDGGTRNALAWLNMGVARMALSTRLAHDLGADMGRPVSFDLGTETIDVAPDTVEVGAPRLDGEDVFAHLFAPLEVEAILPARVLQHHRVVIDYPAHVLALDSIGRDDRSDIATPFRIDPDTGVIAVDVEIDGERHALAVDAGASATWLRGSVVRAWLERHPEWRRADGAVGASNMGLTSLAFEREGTLLTLPYVAFPNGLVLHDVPAFGTAPLICRLCDHVVGDLFWDAWQKNAPGPVAGWIGNDVLGDFRVTVDYPEHVLRWSRRRSQAPRVIDQVGVTLVRSGSGYRIGGIVTKDRLPTLDRVEDGDELLAIDGRAVDGMSSDDVLRRLAGSPGSRHTLTLVRDGARIDVDAPVSRF